MECYAACLATRYQDPDDGRKLHPKSSRRHKQIVGRRGTFLEPAEAKKMEETQVHARAQPPGSEEGFRGEGVER